MSWRSLDETDLQVLEMVRRRGEREAFAGFPAARGWASLTILDSGSVAKLVELGHLQTGCSCRVPCSVRLTVTGYKVLGESLPPRSWGVVEGRRLWP